MKYLITLLITFILISCEEYTPSYFITFSYTKNNKVIEGSFVGSYNGYVNGYNYQAFQSNLCFQITGTSNREQSKFNIENMSLIKP